MSPISLLILVLIVLLVLGSSIFLYIVLMRARKVTFSADPSAKKAEADKKEPPPGEFLHYASNLELRASFSRAVRLLRNYVTGRDHRYRVPWFLMIGES